MMAITTTSQSTASIAPDELLDWAVRHVDPRDDAAMRGAAEMLHSLYNNRDFLRDAVRDELTLLANGRSHKQLSPQIYIHGTRRSPGRTFTVRSCLWSPASKSDPRSLALQDRAFSYGVAHDHNFSLLTIGYLGSGYETDIYEYDSKSVGGLPGESVDLRFRETMTLTEGTILYLRPRKDVHVQRHPSGVSISLNLIGESPEIHAAPQFEFDIGTGKIIGLLAENTVTKQTLPFKLVSLLGANDKLLDLIIQISRRHPAEHIRGAAYSTLAALRTNDVNELLQPGLQDRHAYVQRVVAESLMGG
jgi:hypothetical protein